MEREKELSMAYTKTFKLLTALLLAPLAALHAGDLVIAEKGTCAYQIVIPDKAQDEIVDRWLLMTANLMQASFDKNGFTINVVKEGEKASDKPGIYLGATSFAKANGITVEQHEDWTYYFKAVGKDLIIAGNDKKDPIKTIRFAKTPLALLGTVKGACDFLREYAGVRFLFLNMDQSKFITSGDGPLNIDTRSIAFTPVQKIAVPEGLDLAKTPLMRANYDFDHETFHHLAMNFFPRVSFVQGSEVCWYKVVPPAEYAKSNPEYFALNKDGKRACDLKVPSDDHMEYCVANQGLQDLICKAAEVLIAKGEKTISISAMDAYRLCKCNCAECNTLFGRKAESWEDIRARGDSGKLWQAYFGITERIRQKYPDVKIVLLNYQDTPANEKVIKKFPSNVIVAIQFASQLDFDRLKGVEFPAGICGFEETFTGFGQAGPYLPERTPEHMAEVVQAMARNNVKWSMRDGSIGYVRGMQAPAYYVYGRMMDNPAADWKPLYTEFLGAAFGNVAPQMTRFFELLDKQIAIYSDFFGVFMPAWSRKYSRSTYHDSKWHVKSMYPPEYCAVADSLLTSAEKAATDPDVKARLHLIRIEFDYIRKLSQIFYLQDAWAINTSKANLDALLNAIDDWHEYLEKLAGGTGRSNFKPLSDWPEIRPFSGHSYLHAALEEDRYQQQWKNTCLNWDTQAIRAGTSTNKSQFKTIDK
jgi:hypothetical protein